MLSHFFLPVRGGGDGDHPPDHEQEIGSFCTYSREIIGRPNNFWLRPAALLGELFRQNRLDCRRPHRTKPHERPLDVAIEEIGQQACGQHEQP
jgi:hypothetical protein